MKKVDVREKLIALLKNSPSLDALDDDGYAMGADDLIANGVTLNVRDCHWATEQAYKNGYKQGKQDAVVHGRWEHKSWWQHKNRYEVQECSICGCHVKPRYTYNYCPNCGAKMDGEETKSSGISQRTVQALERMGQKVHGGEDA